MIGSSMSGGASSFVRILFELEQMIEYHKYLNLTTPVVFSQFLLSLSSFHFLDVTALLPSAIFNEIQALSPNDLDNRGPKRVIY